MSIDEIRELAKYYAQSWRDHAKAARESLNTKTSLSSSEEMWQESVKDRDEKLQSGHSGVMEAIQWCANRESDLRALRGRYEMLRDEESSKRKAMDAAWETLVMAQKK